MLLTLLQNSAVLVVLTVVYGYLNHALPVAGVRRSLRDGLVFGAAAVACMSMPLTILPGIIFDARTVILSLGALYAGPLGGLFAGLVAAGHRVAIGGIGTEAGVATIAVAVAAGLLLGRAVTVRRLRLRHFAVLGAGVSIFNVIAFALLPIGFVDTVLAELAPVYVPTLTAATMLLGAMLRDLDAVERVKSLVAASEARFETLFRGAATGFLVLDYADVVAEMARLRERGVTDLADHLRRTPDARDRLARMIGVGDANAAALDLFRLDHARDFATLDWRDGTDEAVRAELLALWAGRRTFAAETTLRRRDGSDFQGSVSMPLPATPEVARRVPMTILDLTELHAAQAGLERERRRLSDFLWGTDAATWEWNLRTGEAWVNDRWAAMLGYTLGELEPLSIDGWRRLVHDDDRAAADAGLAAAFDGRVDVYRCELRMRRADGDWIWIQDRGRVIERAGDGAPLRMAGTRIDITPLKTAVARAERLTATRDAIVAAQALAWQAGDEAGLYGPICDLMVEMVGYPLVWVGVPEADEARSVAVAARAGREAGYLDEARVRWSDDAAGGGPTGRAIRDGHTQVMFDLARQPAFEPWREPALRHAFQAAVAVPVRHGEDVVATLNVYAIDADRLDPEEVGLLEALADTLGFAIAGLRTKERAESLSAALARSALSTVNAVARTIEKRDPYTSGHQARVAQLSCAIAGRLGWSAHRVEGLRLGSLIHDIGKIHVPAEILNRPGRLSPIEMGLIRTHAAVGGEILADIEFPWPIRKMVEQHHERLDGSGYPAGLAGPQIIDEAKVLAVADVVEAITAHRPYRPSLGIEAGLREIEHGRGTIYDAATVDACLATFRADGFDWAATAA